MKHIIYIFVAWLMAGLLGCETDIPVAEETEESAVTFVITNGLPDSIQNGDCSREADYALVILSTLTRSDSYYLSLQDEAGTLRTEPLQLESGDYVVEEFLLFQEGGSPEDRKDDRMVSAAAHPGSELGNLTDHTVSFDLALEPGQQHESQVTVFCNDPLKWKFWWLFYGFVSFEPRMVVVKEALFYGDFCSDEFMAYSGSLYGQFPKIDMPALFSVSLMADQDGDGSYETHILTRNNEENYVNLANQASVPPVSVHYVDTDDETEYYRLDISVYELEGLDPENGQRVFAYRYFTSWYFEDEADLLYADAGYRQNPAQTESFGTGPDGIFDFIVGSCTASGWDTELTHPDQGNASPDETAFAKATSGAICFIESGFTRWGWTNLLRNEPGTRYELPLWAGAAQCETAKGTRAGTLIIQILENNQAEMTYQANSGLSLSETHLFAGTTPYPLKNNLYTIAPGQFPYAQKHPGGTQTHSYSLTIPEDRFFVIAHAVIR